MKPLKYTHSKNVKFTKIQFETLKKLESYNIRVCDFIRKAVSEKLERDKHEILRTKQHCPFSGQEIK